MTLAEVLLWQELRKQPDGVRFRRQHPAGTYALDFYCAPVRLAIEVDGEIHSRGNQPERDVQRDAWLLQHDVLVLRIGAEDILKDLDSVLKHVLSTVRARGKAPSTTR